MEHQVLINNDKCIGCGLCVKDCVGADIVLKDKKAVPKANSCILCGHCEAICPQNAVTITGFSDKVEDFEEQTRLDPKELLDAIKTRRSIRDFSSKEIPEDIVDMIFEAGRLAPTGSNSQDLQYILLREHKDECEALAVALFRKLLKAGKAVIPLLKNMEIDDNFFFKKAPLVIVILSNDTVSGSIAAQNMAFMAEANGLGVLYSGLFTRALRMNSKIKKLTNLPKKIKPVTTLVIGYSNVKYRRTAHRKDLKVIKA